MSSVQEFYAIASTLDLEILLDMLPDILRNDFNTGMNLFCERLDVSEYHKQGVIIFKNYFDTFGDSLDLNINILSSLATIFTLEPEFETEYNRVCAKISAALRTRSMIVHP